ncbi:helix-hairpin-helix domain-containing protein [Flavobacterium sp. RHBU_24]|uniref:helix-hairpin-helix domain-containing protein n=1 Tax=Flavobacterium sp. RHBU_24 TaxID=3391185 RepID=UPI00398536DC
MNANQPIRLTSGQRKGLLALCGLIVLVQAAWFFISRTSTEKKITSEEEKEWIALQPELDALKATADSAGVYKIYPFNPNYITDYKGYSLGMTVAQIDKLKAFRKQNKWVNSAADFQQVTGVSDSLLAVMVPYFKFPDWVTKKQAAKDEKQFADSYPDKETYYKNQDAKRPAVVIKQLDINDALEEDLISVRGIGPAFAKKLLRRRADLGAFVSMDQMDEFKEFSPDAVAGLKAAFKVGQNPPVNTINVNTASLQQLTHFPYFNKDIARAIITQRSMKGKISGFDELSKIDDIFVLKSKIIFLYLEY